MTNFSFKALGSALVATLLTCSAVAQTRYCIGGDLDHLSSAEKASCTMTKEMVKSTATRLHAPDNWHFVIVCGDEGWKDYTAVSQRGETALEGAAADTDLAERVTYIREASLHMPLSGTQRVIAHEIASIQLNTHDEHAIEAQLSVWESTLNAKSDVLPVRSDRQQSKPNQTPGL